jgi:hypothetical protein
LPIGRPRLCLGNPARPQPSEIDDALKRFITKCWREQLRMSGKPQ